MTRNSRRKQTSIALRVALAAIARLLSLRAQRPAVLADQLLAPPFAARVARLREGELVHHRAHKPRRSGGKRIARQMSGDCTISVQESAQQLRVPGWRFEVGLTLQMQWDKP